MKLLTTPFLQNNFRQLILLQLIPILLSILTHFMSLSCFLTTQNISKSVVLSFQRVLKKTRGIVWLSGVIMTSKFCFEHLWKKSYLGSAVSYKAKESHRCGRSEVCCRISCLKKILKIHWETAEIEPFF